MVGNSVRSILRRPTHKRVLRCFILPSPWSSTATFPHPPQSLVLCGKISEWAGFSTPLRDWPPDVHPPVVRWRAAAHCPVHALLGALSTLAEPHRRPTPSSSRRCVIGPLCVVRTWRGKLHPAPHQHQSYSPPGGTQGAGQPGDWPVWAAGARQAQLMFRDFVRRPTI